MTVPSITATLYAPDGISAPAGAGAPVVLTLARRIGWQHEVSKAGTASFEVPLDDADTALIVDRSIVKFSLPWSSQDADFACVIKSQSCAVAVDGTRWLRFENQPGVFALLGDGIVRPEYGLARKSESARRFGYMSKAGAWRVASEWVTPTGYAWSTDATRRQGFPLVFEDADPDWISVAGPDVTVADGTVNYFRRTFTTTDPLNVSILAPGDNFLTLWLDGKEIIPADLEQPYGWLDAKAAPATLDVGEHVLAARVENAPITFGDNPLAFICEIVILDDHGRPDGILLKTNTASWYAHDNSPEPGWFRPQVFKACFDEECALTPPALGPSLLTLGFDDDVDSNGDDWDIPRGEYVLDIATTSLEVAATKLSESHFDLDVNFAAMVLDGYPRLGTDRRASVALELGEDDGSLKRHETSLTSVRRTDVVTQLSDGRWVETTDATALSAVGRIAVGLSLGSTSTPATATAVARQALDDSAAPKVAIESETSTLTGPLPYDAYFLGDTITVPGHADGGTIPARVLAITVDGTGDKIRAWPEVVHDQS